MKYVVVTTKSKGVFFGRILKNNQQDSVTLADARCCLYWSKELKGFMGLASTGPTENCRVGPAVSEITLYDITAILDCTETATKAWEQAPWKI